MWIDKFFKNNFSRIQTIAKELFQVGLGQAMATLGGLVGVRLLTQIMTPSSYGELALSMTFLIFIQQLVMGPVTNGIARYFPIAEEKQGTNEYLKSVWSLLVKASFITFVIFIIVLIGLFVTNNLNWKGLLFYSFLYALISSYNVAFDNMQNAARQRAVVAWHQGISQWLRFLLAAGIILLFDSTSSFAMLGYLGSAVLVLISQWYFFRRTSFFQAQNGKLIQGEKSSSTWERQIIQFALPFSIWGIFTWAQISSDRWALQAFMSTAIVGLYTVIYQLGYYPISLLTGVFVQFISPILYRRVGDASELTRVRSTQRFTNQLTLASLGFTVVVTVIVWVFRDVIFQVLVAPEYRGVSKLLPWMALSGGLFAAGQISTLTALNNNKPYALLKPKIATSVLGVILSFFGAYFYGLNGVVGAGVLFSLIYFLWVYLLFRH